MLQNVSERKNSRAGGVRLNAIGKERYFKLGSDFVLQLLIIHDYSLNSRNYFGFLHPDIGRAKGKTGLNQKILDFIQ